MSAILDGKLMIGKRGCAVMQAVWSCGPSSVLRKVKQVLERLLVTGSGRAVWPVLEVERKIVWMKGVEVEAEAGLDIEVVEVSEG